MLFYILCTARNLFAICSGLGVYFIHFDAVLIIQINSGITCGRILSGELYTQTL